MPIFRAGVTVGLLMIGAIMALLGLILLISAVPSGEIHISRDASHATEIISRANDSVRYWQYLIGLGVTPLILGSILVRWAWRQIQTGGH